MEALLFVGVFAYLAVVGFWMMGKVDGFLLGGNVRPHWDEQGEREARPAKGNGLDRFAGAPGSVKGMVTQFPAPGQRKG